MPHNIIVIAREVWDTRDLVGQVVDDTGAVKTAALTTRYDTEDLNALEMALRLKDQHGGKVTVLSAGAPGAVDVLREALYRGADEAIRVNAARGDLDTQAAAKVYAAAIRKIGTYDLILLGVNVPEGENALLGSHLAAQLGVEQISYVDNIDQLGNGTVTGKRAIEMGYEFVEAPLPALLSVGVALVADDPRTPRSAKATLKLRHKKTNIPAWEPADLGIADPKALRTTVIAGYHPIEERVVDTKDVDPESESALSAMLGDVLKGS
ncbi:MAG: electron transfer flavoprotein beta subunit/FixA family protein [bacterium]